MIQLVYKYIIAMENGTNNQLNPIVFDLCSLKHLCVNQNLKESQHLPLNIRKFSCEIAMYYSSTECSNFSSYFIHLP